MTSHRKPAATALTRILLCGFFLCAACDAGEWRIIGPGGGGTVLIPAVSPHNPNDVLAGCDMTGSYISHDGGASWRMFNFLGPTNFFVFDPVDANVIYASGAGLFRSVDRGATWRLAFPSPDSVTGMLMPDDHASARILSRGSPQGRLTAFAIDPADSHTLYAAIGRGESALFISSDWGRTWRNEANLPAGGGKIYIDPKSPRGQRDIYVVGRDRVSARLDGRWVHHEAVPGVHAFTDAGGGFAADGKLRVYAVTEADLFVSPDGGTSWKRSALPGIRQGRFQVVASSLGHGEVAYLSYADLFTMKGLVFGIARTGDGGKTWQLTTAENGNTRAPNFEDGWLTQRFGPGWGGNPEGLGVSPVDPNIAYAGDSGRLIRTLDGGKTWKAVYTRQVEAGGWMSTGIDVTTNYGVHFDPFDPRRMFISYTDIGLFRSEDGGKSWTSSTAGVPGPWVNTTYWVAFDPQVRGRMWGAMSYTHDLPRPKMWRDQQPANFNGGVTISEDGGKTWRISNVGMPRTPATHILLDPKSPADARVLYVTGFGKGVFKSADSGKSWRLMNQGIRQSEPFAWRFAGDPHGNLYVIVARRSDDGSIGNSGDGAVYRSTDGAESWNPVKLPEGVNGPNGLLVDPADPKRLYLAAWRRSTPDATAGGGIYLSKDGGATWRNVLVKDQHVYDVTIDPRQPSILYACGFESSAWRSTDRGDTWQRIPGYNFKWGHRVIPDPQDPSKIYITTYGGSVWHGPAAGDRKSIEDLIAPELVRPR
ncbi:MAG: hypothetical protein U0Q18_34710 [Bryobacteraceae bacterium]